MSGSRILLITQKEALQFFRARKVLLLIIAMAGMAVSQAVILSVVLPLPVFSFNAILYGSYNILVQLAPLALATVLAASVCGEKESRVWYFYLSKPFRKTEIVLGKILFYDIMVLMTTLLAWLVTIGVAWQIARPTSTPWLGLLYVGVILLSVIFMVVNMEIMLSALVRKTAVAALLIVIAWIGLTIINAVLYRAFGDGLVAPYAAYSVQTNTVMRLLEMVPAAGCPSCPPPGIPLFSEIIKVSLYPLLEGILLAFLAVVVPRTD